VLPHATLAGRLGRQLPPKVRAVGSKSQRVS
jgi:hypothetical protein